MSSNLGSGFSILHGFLSVNCMILDIWKGSFEFEKKNQVGYQTNPQRFWDNVTYYININQQVSLRECVKE